MGWLARGLVSRLDWSARDLRLVSLGWLVGWTGSLVLFSMAAGPARVDARLLPSKLVPVQSFTAVGWLFGGAIAWASACVAHVFIHVHEPHVIYAAHKPTNKLRAGHRRLGPAVLHRQAPGQGIPGTRGLLC